MNWMDLIWIAVLGGLIPMTTGHGALNSWQWWAITLTTVISFHVFGG